MAKFVFPVRQESAVAMFSTEAGRKVLAELGTNEIGFGISCLRTGWTNKQHHKARQEEDRALVELLKSDPKLRQAVEAKIKKTA